MANFTGAQRSNYVKFKAECLEEVTDYLSQFGIKMHTGTAHPGTHCLIPDDMSDDGMFCSLAYNDAGEDIYLDFGWVAQQMEVGQVLVLEAIGNEKLRYLMGVADAWSHEGEWAGISIGEIYERAAEHFGVPADSITQASY